MTKLYHDLRLNHHAIYRERELEKQLEYLKESVRPMSELHNQMANKAIRRLKWYVNNGNGIKFFLQNTQNYEIKNSNIFF